MLVFLAVLLSAAARITGTVVDELACPPKHKCKWITDERFPAVGSARGVVDSVQVFCYLGTDHSRPDFLAKAWTRIRVLVDTSVAEPERNFLVYRGANYSDVLHAKTQTDAVWLQWPWQEGYIDISPYGVSCFGLTFRTADTSYVLNVQDTRILLRFPLLLIFGVGLFFLAPSLAQNVAFYYATSTTIGVLAFLLVLVFIISRFIPNKGVMYTVLVGGWAVSAYFVRYLSEHAHDIAVHYQTYIYGYVATATVVSAAYCYWKGPPSNPRSLKLIQLFIQAISMVMIYCGTQSDILSGGVMVTVLAAYWLDVVIPVFVRNWAKRKWLLWFPPERKLLSQDEYDEQGRVETEKALQELRQHLNSPGASPWRVVRRLKDPTRFATFAEGGEHVEEDETFLHERHMFLNTDGYHEHRQPHGDDDENDSE